MEKKLTKFDIVIVLSFLLALVVGVGAFFYGLQVGKQQTDAKYQSFIEGLKEKDNEVQVSYHQQQLVSFYHTVLLPYQEFQDTWFKHLAAMEANADSTDANELLKQLGRLAKEKAAEIKPTTIPVASPLLRESQTSYLKSLTLFAQAADKLQNGSKGRLLLQTIEEHPYVTEASAYALSGQQQFYEAIWKWNEANDPNLLGADLTTMESISIDQWRGLNLNGKNLFISRKLARSGAFTGVYPQDIAARIDDLDAAGQVGKLKLTDISSAVDTLLSTGAVRSNDYKESKDKHYRDEFLPQLPFF